MWGVVPMMGAQQAEAKKRLAPSIKLNRVYQRVTKLDMTGATIDATLLKPDGIMINPRRESAKQTLIKLRPHWKDKIRQAVQSL